MKDATGERRFFPIRCGVTKPTKTVWRNEESVPKIDHDVHQVLAEVKTWVDAGESVFADDKLMQLAKPYQQEAETVDPMKVGHRRLSQHESAIKLGKAVIEPEGQLLSHSY